MSFWAKLTYYNKKDYQFSFHYLQICYNVSILLLNERFLQALIRADSLPLCSRNSKKGVDSRRFTFEPGLRQPLE